MFHINKTLFYDPIGNEIIEKKSTSRVFQLSCDYCKSLYFGRTDAWRVGKYLFDLGRHKEKQVQEENKEDLILKQLIRFSSLI